MRTILVATLIWSVASPATPAVARSHLVSPERVEERLTGAKEHRKQDLATLVGILSHSTVRSALVSIHFDPEDLAAKASSLSDRELHDLADRAARLEVDPGAGGIGKGLLIAFAVVGIAFTALLIVCSSSGCE
jgi:hypothetical protein